MEWKRKGIPVRTYKLALLSSELKFIPNCLTYPINFTKYLESDIFKKRFRIEIELIKCPPTKEEWEKAYRIYAVGLPDGITLDVKTLCDCPCEDPSNGVFICLFVFFKVAKLLSKLIHNFTVK